MRALVAKITSLTIVYSTRYPGTDEKNQSSAPLAFVRGKHRWPVNSPHKGPVTRKMFPFDDATMSAPSVTRYTLCWPFCSFTFYFIMYAYTAQINLFNCERPHTDNSYDFEHVVWPGWEKIREVSKIILCPRRHLVSHMLPTCPLCCSSSICLFFSPEMNVIRVVILRSIVPLKCFLKYVVSPVYCHISMYLQTIELFHSVMHGEKGAMNYMIITK